MKITQKDKRLLLEINQFGFVDIDYITRQFDWHLKSAYRRLRQLALNQFIEYDEIFHNQPRAYRLTSKGVSACQDTLPHLRKINLATYTHDLSVAKLSVMLRQRYKGQFTSERHLRRKLGCPKLKQTLHIPDGILEFDNQKIAIEVELTVKSKSRLEKIMRHYRKAVEYDEVWYFCGDTSIENKLSDFVDLYSFLKIYPLPELK